MISFKTQGQATAQPEPERLVEYNLEDLQSTKRNEDAGLLARPLEKRTVVMKEMGREMGREEAREDLDDVAQQKKSSLLKEPSPSPPRTKGKSVKFNEGNEDEDVSDSCDSVFP